VPTNPLPIQCGKHRFSYERITLQGHKGLQASRLCLLVILLSALGMLITIEQPDSSLLEQYPRVQELLSTMKLFKIKFRMFDYGGETAKGTLLYSSHPWINDLYKYRQVRVGEKQSAKLCEYFERDGVKKFRGNKQLKSSQAYPSEFGDALTSVFAERRAELVANGEELRANVQAAQRQLDMAQAARLIVVSQPVDSWEDAMLGHVFEYINMLR
jgi:hypothetical protein